MKVNVEKGKRYHFSGDIKNGWDENGPVITHEEVTRCVRRVTDTEIVCECGRVFLINENLKVEEVNYVY